MHSIALALVGGMMPVAVVRSMYNDIEYLAIGALSGIIGV